MEMKRNRTEHAGSKLPGTGRLWLMLCLLVQSAALPAAVSGWKPEKNVELIVGAAAGGGIDRTARTIQSIWQETRLVDATTTVVNKPGGGSSVGWTYLNQHAGDPHYLSITTPSLLSNRIVGASVLRHEDFTPIGLLFTEYLGLAVKADSPVMTVEDLIDRLKKNPSSVSIAIGTPLGGTNHIGVGLAAKAAGIEIRRLKIVNFKAGGESIAALLGGHVDVVASSPANLAPMLEAGRLRVLVLAAPGRQGGVFAAVPTLREKGIEGVAPNWRGVIAPKGISEEQAAYWESAIAKLTQTAEWNKDLRKYFWTNTYLNRAASKKFFDSQYVEIKAVLTDLGLAK